MGDILSTTADYDEVRKILGVTSTQVPDATFTGFAHLGRAEAWAKNKVANWQAIMADTSTTDYTNLKTAVACYVANRLASYLLLNIYDRLKLGDAEYQRNRQLDWEAKQASWLDDAWLALSEINSRKALDTAPPKPSLTGPTRSGVSV